MNGWILLAIIIAGLCAAVIGFLVAVIWEKEIHTGWDNE